MSIFGRIKDAIVGAANKTFGRETKPEPARPTAAPAPSAMPQIDTPSDPNAGQGAPANQAELQGIDIEAVLTARAAEAGQDLNWRTSIVDLMKLLDLDSSLQNRQELARELNYPGDMNDSAAMNIWLHKAVMNTLEYNGGIVPAEFKD